MSNICVNIWLNLVTCEHSFNLCQEDNKLERLLFLEENELYVRLNLCCFRYDLLSILIKVNEEVSKAVAQVEDQMYKQTPAPMPTLRKKVYFS